MCRFPCLLVIYLTLQGIDNLWSWLACRDLGVNKLYSFETWARQLLDFTAHFVGEESAFLICNSVGGAASALLMLG